MMTKVFAPKRSISISLLCLIVAALTAAAAPAAEGAVQVGQLMPSGSKELACLPELNAVQTAVGSGASYQLPSNGVITHWKFLGVSASTSSVSLQVWRRAQGNTFQLVGSSEPRSIKKGVNTFTTDIAAQDGDYIGLHTFAELDACAFNRGGGNKPLGASGPNPSPGERLDFERSDSARLNIQATLEPDADCDGLGDESQDKALSGGCLPPAAARLVSHKARMQHGKAKLKISCPTVGGNCAGNKLVLRSKKKISIGGRPAAKIVVGRARFSMTAGSTRKIKVKLTKKAKSALKAAIPIKAKATIEASSPTAVPRTSKSAVKLRG